MPNHRAERGQNFESNCLTWIALIHFLPATLVRELSYKLIEVVSQGEINMADLFEEQLVGDDGALDAWSVRPLEAPSPLGGYLQQRIRAFVWQADYRAPFLAEGKEKERPITSESVEAAVRLGQSDLADPPEAFENLHFPEGDSIHALLKSITAARSLRAAPGVDDFLASGSPFRELSMPLLAIATKHLGDLFAFIDEWERALILYKRAAESFSSYDNPAWTNLTKSLRSISDQSIASALRTIQGPDSAATFLAARLEASLLNEAPVFLLNASHDALVAASVGPAGLVNLPRDRRASLLWAPQLLASKNLAPAVEASLEKKFADAQRYFWRTLRRQVALGSASESRTTKAYFAQSIFQQLESDIEKQKDERGFFAGIRLLLESGQFELAKQISWGEALVRTYVSGAAVKFVDAFALRNEGARYERVAVAIEILRGWMIHLRLEQAEVAELILTSLAHKAKEYEASGFTAWNVGGRSLEILGELAEERPEFRQPATAPVMVAIIANLRRRQFWTGTAEALKTAIQYLEVLRSDELKDLISATLVLLEGMDTAHGSWPILQPGLELLLSDESQRASQSDPDLASRIVATVLRFGLGQKTEHARLLLYLNSSTILKKINTEMLGRLIDVVRDVRQQALAVNSSSAVYNICALLYGSAVAGSEGVQDAITALSKILKSALNTRPSISFVGAHQGILALASRERAIAGDLSISVEDYRGKVSPILELIFDVWERAKHTPTVFAPFSIPPRSTPSAVAVHNWAFASIALAQTLGQRDRMMSALASAETQSQLKSAIGLARATRLIAGDPEPFNPESIRLEEREAFYAALGRRLLILQRADASTRKITVDALIDKCLQVGPRGLDAAIFLLASETGAKPLNAYSEFTNYQKRLEHDRDLRLSLRPLLNELLEKDAGPNS